jgi:hypothetical protein
MTMWEVFSFGDKPYGELSDGLVLGLIKEGKYPEKPDSCPSKQNLFKGPEIFIVLQRRTLRACAVAVEPISVLNKTASACGLRRHLRINEKVLEHGPFNASNRTFSDDVIGTPHRSRH